MEELIPSILLSSTPLSSKFKNKISLSVDLLDLSIQQERLGMLKVVNDRMSKPKSPRLTAREPMPHRREILLTGARKRGGVLCGRVGCRQP